MAGSTPTSKKLEIYLGDITYDTVSLSTEAIPLSIGYIAAYCNSVHGSQTRITLFKYLEELESAIADSPPDILGLSNYVWNTNIGNRMFELAHKQNPDTLTVWGGPNLPIDLPSQDRFLQEHPDVDVYVQMEGEKGFSEVVGRALEARQRGGIRGHATSRPIGGCIVRHNKTLHRSAPIPRCGELDEIPSPYTTGLLDKFFDGKLSPMIQTNRGCPFQCTFCVDGTDDQRKINQFSMRRVLSEIDYVAGRVPERTNLLLLADLNFGMMPRDRQICEGIARAQKQHGYPRKIDCSTGKNCKERVVDAIRILNGALPVKLSVQSTDMRVLGNVKRNNISVENMVDISREIKGLGLPTMTEIIVGLPGASLASNINTIRDMLRVDVDEYMIYTLKLIHGSELSMPSERRRWRFRTKFRILPRSFVRMSDGKKIIETEEIVVGHDQMSFEDYVQLQLLSLSVFAINQPAYKPIVKFLHQSGVDVFELIKMAPSTAGASSGIRDVFEKFRHSVCDELWDSPEGIIERFQDDGEYERLQSGQIGFNTVRFHNAMIVRDHMDEWTEHIISLGTQLLLRDGAEGGPELEQWKDVANYCRGATRNLLGRCRDLGDPEFLFSYDVRRWNSDTSGTRLEGFRFGRAVRLVFVYAQENVKLFRDNMGIYGTSIHGISQVLKRVPKHALCRIPAASAGRDGVM